MTMRVFNIVGVTISILVAGFFICAMPVKADDDFYKGKKLTFVIGVNPGGGYDLYARLLGRYWGRYLPGNPIIVPQNMNGAGSLVATNYIYKLAPKDGTYVGAVMNGLPFEPLFSDKGIQFDATKMSWIGNLNEEVNLLVLWHTVPVNTVQDLVGRETILAGGAGAGSDNTLPLILNALLNTKLKVIGGYSTSADRFLAMERGEVEGSGMYWSSLKATQMSLYQSGKLKILLQVGLEKDPELPHVPLVLDMAKTAEDRQLMKVLFSSLTMGRPILAPPGLPATRIAELRDGFDKAVADPALRADAEKQHLEVNPMTGAAVEKMVRSIYSSPPEIIARARNFMR